MSKHPRNPKPNEKGVSTHDSVDTGENLQQLVDRVGPLPWALVRWIALQVSELLTPIHAKGLVHSEISPKAIFLARPWPEHEVILSEQNSKTGNAIEDLRLLAKSLEWLLSGGKSQEGPLSGATAESRRIISALSEGSIPDAQTLSDILLESLPEQNEAVNHPRKDSDLSKDSPHTLSDLQKRPTSFKIAAGAAAAILIGVGSYFIFKQPSKDTSGENKAPLAPTESTEDLAAKKAAAKEAAAEQAAKEQAAKELVAKEAAAKELAAKEAAEKEAAAMELAAKKAAAQKRAAIEEAQEKALKEKAIQDEALISKNTEIIESPDASPEEKEQAFSEVLILAEDGNINAIELCGASYWQGQGVTKDRVTARIWFERGAKLGNARSMLGLGYCYELPIGGPKDMTKAVEWWTKAANLGYEKAMSKLGDHFFQNPESKDIEKAIEWWQKAAEAEPPSTDAMTNLGVIYSTGIEIDKDLEKAEKWLQQAVDLGAPEAMAVLGITYYTGVIKGKEADSFPLFLKAAEAGSLRAMYGLVNCYQNGIGTEKNPAEAERWKRISSELEKASGR
ncbi:MAG: hypothetical protein ACSHX9_02945 [Luteolibacter sp.]